MRRRPGLRPGGGARLPGQSRARLHLLDRALAADGERGAREPADPGRRAGTARCALWALVGTAERVLERCGVVPTGSQILPLVLGDDARTMRVAARGAGGRVRRARHQAADGAAGYVAAAHLADAQPDGGGGGCAGRCASPGRCGDGAADRRHRHRYRCRQDGVRRRARRGAGRILLEAGPGRAGRKAAMPRPSRG